MERGKVERNDKMLLLWQVNSEEVVKVELREDVNRVLHRIPSQVSQLVRVSS